MRLLRLLAAAVAAFAIVPLLLLWPRAHRALRPHVWRLARRRATPVVMVQPRAPETRNQRKRRRRTARG